MAQVEDLEWGLLNPMLSVSCILSKLIAPNIADPMAAQGSGQSPALSATSRRSSLFWQLGGSFKAEVKDCEACAPAQMYVD